MMTHGQWSLRWSAVLLLLLGTVVLPRVTDLGTTLTNDEPIWQGRAHQFMIGLATLQPSLTFSGGQPGVTTMWVAGLANRFEDVRASQMAIALAASILVLFATVLLARLVGTTIGFLGGFFLALDPFLIAHSRLVHTDAFLALFMLMTLLLLALTWKTGSPRYLVLSGIGTSLAMLSKLMGAFTLLPGIVTVLTGPLALSRPRRLFRYGTALLLTLLFLWPALLSPAGPIQYMKERLFLHAQETDVGKGAGDPWYYPREWLFRLTPVTTIAGAVGLGAMVIGTGRLLPRLRGRRFFLALTGATILYGLFLNFGGQRSDRYFLLGTLTTDIIAAAGIVWAATVIERLVPAVKKHLIVVLLGVLSVGLLARDAARLHPYALAHYNRLFPVPREKKLGWGEGLERAAAWVETHRDSTATAVYTYYPSVFKHWYDGNVERLGHEYGEGDQKVIVLYRSMFGRKAEGRETRYLMAYFTHGHCRHGIHINGLPYVWIFHRLNEEAFRSEEGAPDRQALQLPSCDSTEELAS